MKTPETDVLREKLLAAQELNFAKVLAGNDKKLRDRAVKKLIKWLAIRSKGKTAFTEDNFQRIWSGLFYCMWMSDKFLVQEELAESISKLIHCFHNNSDAALLFIKVFNKVMSVEWPGIDQHRIDKFCMLIRRFLRQSLEYCRRKDWDNSLVTGLAEIFNETILNTSAPDGIVVHFIDIFPEELAKIGRGKLTVETTMILLEPFIKLMACTCDLRIQKSVINIFYHLIKQTDIGIEYEEKLHAWKQLGMPCKSPLQLKNCSDETSEEEEMSDSDEMFKNEPLDPRAGKVDAYLPQIPVDSDAIISCIKKYMHLPTTSTKAKRLLKSLISKFATLKKGKMPEYIKKPKILFENKSKRRFTQKCAKKLIEYSKKLAEEEEGGGDELVCNEIDSDDDEVEEEEMSDESDSSPPKKSNGIKKLKNGDVNSQTKKVKLKSEKKKVKKEKRKEGMNVKKNKVIEEEKEMTPAKPKSPKDAFKIEDISGKSNKLVITGSKRKALSAWQVHDLEAGSEEHSKIQVPKIIKLEMKGCSPLSQETVGKELIMDTPVKKKVSLTPTFWDKAKEKALKKKNSGSNLLLNPFYPGEKSKNSKRISFALDRNEAQENEEYLEEVRNSPSIPFDGTRKPVQSALKTGLSPSPINPFYHLKRFK